MTYRKKISIVVLFSAILIGGFFLVWRRIAIPKDPTLEEAAKMGEVATHKLLVQIENPKGKAEDMNGRYERGDIVLIFPAEHQFSRAEQEGFLIVQMDLTLKQAEILTRAKEEAPKTLKRRKFTVDLTKIGIEPDDQRGREIGDRIFEWSVITEK